VKWHATALSGNPNYVHVRADGTVDDQDANRDSADKVHRL